MPHAARSTRWLLLASVLAFAPGFAVSAPGAPKAVKPDTMPADPTSRALLPLMKGEFALQAGRLNEALTSYLEAAEASRDPALAEQATQIALLARDDARATRALALWRTLGGQGTPVAAADAVLALRRGDERAARASLSTLLRAPGDEGWRKALAVIAGGARDPAQAARVVNGLLDAHLLPASLQAWLAFGGLAQRLDQPALTERIVGEVVKRFPGEPRVALLRASQLREAGKKDEARALLAGVMDRAASDAELRLATAAELDRLGELVQAAEVLSRGPQDEQTYALRASLLARAEDRTALAALYERLSRDAAKPDPQRRLLLGQVAEFLKRYDEALEWYGGVPGGAQRDAARLRAANVLFELKRAPEAYAALRELQADASLGDGSRRDAYVLEAALRAKAGDLSGEMDAYSRGLAAFPDEAELLYARALAWERRDDIARAEADLRRVLVAEPDNVAALNALGYTLADRTTRYTEALELIERARVAEPDNAAIVDSYGWVLYRLGKPRDAAVELRRALNLQKDAEIAAHLGEVLWKLGQRDEARRYFEQSKQLDADNRSLQRALKETGA